MNFELHLGDCVESMRVMSDKTVQTCVTSPPYFGLRDYGHEGQIGLEQTPDEYVAKLVAVFREVRRVLKDDGTLWLNLGDSYANDTKWGGSSGGKHASGLHGATSIGRGKVKTGLKPKDLIGIPWMVAFALRTDGWYLRQGIIWHKPNPMPESVTDRFTKAHEDIFLLSKSPRYYFDHEAVKEPAVGGQSGRAATFDRSGNPVSEHILPGQSAAQHRKRFPTWEERKAAGAIRGNLAFDGNKGTGHQGNVFGEGMSHTLGSGDGKRNRRSVWTVATRPYKGAHFATFPPALIEPCILAGSRPGDIVLDPFGGSGTTAQVALEHGRRAVLCELNPDYAPLIRERVCGGFA